MSGGQSSSTNPSSSHTPRDARVMASILKDAGVDEYEPRVINQMLEFAYRYVSDVLDDARIYSEYSSKKSIDADDVRLAVRMKVENTLTNPPSREMLAELAQEKNAVPLPALKQQYGLRLPPDRYCTLQPNYRLKSNAIAPATIGGGTSRNASVASSTTAPAASIRNSQQQSTTNRPKSPSSITGGASSTSQKPRSTTTTNQQSASEQSPISSAIAAAKPAPSTAAAAAPKSNKPLFRFVSGSSSAAPPPNRPSTSTNVAGGGGGQTTEEPTGGVKRKLEPLDEDYDQM